MTPSIVPFLAMRNSPASGIGAAIGFILCLVFTGVMWGLRPLILPRRGEWIDHSYFVGDTLCGDVTYYDFGWAAMSEPPMWIGLDDYKTYREEAAAKRAVEWSCK